MVRGRLVRGDVGGVEFGFAFGGLDWIGLDKGVNEGGYCGVILSWGSWAAVFLDGIFVTGMRMAIQMGYI